jgi:cyclophilin family peptidyl-prolyl cis-trans isomerase/HEAT repeat protein
MGVVRVLAPLWLVVAVGCASAPPVVGPSTPPVPVASLDQRVAWILRLEAQRWLADSAVPLADLRILVSDSEPAVRRRAALAVGRVGQTDGVAILTPALADVDPDVRASAAFGLGLIGQASAEPVLRTALADADPRVRGRAAEALGLIAVATGGAREAWTPSASAVADAFVGCGALMTTIAPDDEGPKAPDVEACRLALFALVRLRHFESLARVAVGADGQAVSQWWPVAFALQRINDPRAASALEPLLRSAGVYTAGYALRGLAGQPLALPVAQRFAIDDAADPRLRVTAIRALGRPNVPPAADTLLGLLGSKTLSTTLLLEVMTALTATVDPRVFDVMVDRFTDKRPQIRAAAIAAAARLDPEAFVFVISSLPADREWSVRAALATALGGLDPDKGRAAILDLVDDQDQRVRGPALTALARVGAPDLANRLYAALEAPDFVVRSTAARLIGEQKLAGSVPALVKAYERGLSDAAMDARASAVVAAQAVGGDEAAALVTRALQDREWAVRVRAGMVAGRRDEVGRPAPLRHAPEFFESAGLLHPKFSPMALIETRHGVIEIELNVVDAPLTTTNFIELTRAGFFNGLRWHRVVANFVAQAGDPRGDGVGGPGYALVDELSPLPFTRGTVGMALSWEETGGSQFFITHSPQPHLDGQYTVFGRVVKGMDVVDRLGPDDVIDRMRIWDGLTLR